MDRRILRLSPGRELILDFDGRTVSWASREWIPNDLLKRLAEGRKVNRRAPLGDSHGAWEKVAEVPASVFFKAVPPQALDDRRAVARLVNDRDFRAFRCDGDFRRY